MAPFYSLLRLRGVGTIPTQPVLVLVPAKKTSEGDKIAAAQINSLVRLLKEYRNFGQRIVDLAREIRDHAERGGEVEESFHDVQIRTFDDGPDRVPQLVIDGRSVSEWMGKDERMR